MRAAPWLQGRACVRSLLGSLILTLISLHAITAAGQVPQPYPPPVVRDVCSTTEACRVQGRCTSRGDRCVAGGDYECWASEGCRDDGRCTLNPDEAECDDGMERSNPALYATGIVIMGHGAATTVIGGLVFFFSLFGPSIPEQIAGLVMMPAGGLLVFAVGLPMALVGRCPVPRQPSWRVPGVAVELQANGVTLSF